MQKFPNLFSPLKVGPLTLKNRIEVAPMGVSHGSPDGYLTTENLAEFELRAKGGSAIIHRGETIVHMKTGSAHGGKTTLDDDALMPSLIKMAEEIHRYGALASIEMVHCGARAHPRYTEGGKVYGPSAQEGVYGTDITPLDEEMMDEIAEAFAQGAFMSQFGGLDLCMLHGGHGWLLSQFLSPLYNQRTDQFGGSLENRARFPLMVIDRIRQKCGKDFPIEYRLSGSEFMEGGYTLDDMIEFSKMLDGKVDIIHVSATSFRDPNSGTRMFPSMFLSHGCNVFLAEAIKKVVNTPVATVGALNDPAHLEEIIASGKADIVAIGRGILADPFLPEKAKNGREDDITPCIRCNSCISRSFVPYVPFASKVLRCSVNPIAGKELDLKFAEPKPKKKKILIAGGGPGGMEAAITAADRGHEVILCEKRDSLGGMLKLAIQTPFKVDLKSFMELLIQRVQKRNIEIRLQAEVTPELAKEISPDFLILAVGGEPTIPDIPGVDNPKVMTITNLYSKNSIIGDKVAIIGGGLVGCEEGLALAMQGKDVTIIEMLDKIAKDAPVLHLKAMMLEFLKHPNLKVKKNARCYKITDEGVFAKDLDSKEMLYEADTVLLATGLTSHTEIVDSLRQSAPDYMVIGDCLKPKTVFEAIQGGYDAGRRF